MSKNHQFLIPNFNNFLNCHYPQRFRFILLFVTVILLLPLQQTRSEEIFLKCIGKYEIDRGALIKPDWETSYLSINLDGLISTIYEKGVKKVGRTLIRRNSYIITQRDKRNSVKNIYKINSKHGTFIIESPKSNRTLIGSCQKGRG